MHTYAEDAAHLSPKLIVDKRVARTQPRSGSDSNFRKSGLYFSLRARFLFSARFTGGGVPITARDAALTALVARNFFAFFLLGTGPILTMNQA